MLGLRARGRASPVAGSNLVKNGPGWRNWQTRWIQVPLSSDVRVQVPPRVPLSVSSNTHGVPDPSHIATKLPLWPSLASTYTSDVDRSVIESGLAESTTRLLRVRGELADVDQRLTDALTLVEDLRLRALTSETPLAGVPLAAAEQVVDALLQTREGLAQSAIDLRRAHDRLQAQLPKAH